MQSFNLHIENTFGVKQTAALLKIITGKGMLVGQFNFLQLRQNSVITAKFTQ
ncbi:hypothetical protein SDC9_178406 [bioreactor metagenome]|uniref:Uncharacterized protein n=1 Tax=bioreactor metagenome TaxID=1076179 RepID=A0A645GVV8_9ZZZZ